MDIPASQAYVGLALPGEAGSFQRECKVKKDLEIPYILFNILYSIVHYM